MKDTTTPYRLVMVRNNKSKRSVVEQGCLPLDLVSLWILSPFGSHLSVDLVSLSGRLISLLPLFLFSHSSRLFKRSRGCQVRALRQPNSWTNFALHFIATSPTIILDGETTWCLSLEKECDFTSLPKYSSTPRPSSRVRRYRRLRKMNDPFQVVVDSSRYP